MTGISNNEALKIIDTLNLIELVKELRVRTHLGLTECKKALEESHGDIDKALEFLQKRGLKKIDDFVIPMEGVVRASFGKNNMLNMGYGIIVEFNCQTDFGARSELFQNFINEYLKDPNVSSEMLNLALTQVSNQLGEKVVFRRSDFIYKSSDNIITTYNHLGDKIAVLLESLVPQDQQKNPQVLALLDNIAMQIAATKPLSLDRDSLNPELVQKKIAFYTEEIKHKPEQVQAKILAGKMNKWYSEVTLLEQEAVFLDDGIKETISNQIDKLGIEVKLQKFIRYERGENQ